MQNCSFKVQESCVFLPRLQKFSYFCGMKETIILQNAVIGYHSKKKNRVVAQGLNASLLSGELTCLIGANGTGKSTLLRTLSGFQSPLSGKVLLAMPSEQGNLKSVSQLSQKQLALALSVVLTSSSDSVNLTVGETVGMGRSPYTNFWGQLSSEDERIVVDALQDVGILHLKGRKLCTLSDGERQKVMIAKALAQQTPIIFLDEPTAFLDYPSKVDVLLMLKRLAHQHRKAILVSTHDVEMVLQLADRIWLMEKFTSQDPLNRKEERCTQLSIGTPRELAANGAISRFLDGKGLAFDKESLKITISGQV